MFRFIPWSMLLVLFFTFATGCGDPEDSDTDTDTAVGTEVDTEVDTDTDGPTCSDGIRNGQETDVDCGGSCDVCDAGEGCITAADCADSVCIAGSCREASCTDGVANGSESDVDCGGDCGGCAVDEVCAVADDCGSGVCTANQCMAPTCADGVGNGEETDVDCGGSCAPCSVGSSCLSVDDCLASNCYEATCQEILIITGTAVSAGQVQVFEGQARLRVDFASPPTVVGFDGAAVELPTTADGSFVSSEFVGAFPNAIVRGNDADVIAPNGRVFYQTIAQEDFYGVVIDTVSEADAQASQAALLTTISADGPVTITVE